LIHFQFRLQRTDPLSDARRGQVTTAHGPFETPAFMTVGTLGSVKGLPPWEVERTGAEVILGNTYHLYLRPGMEVIKTLGGLHRMMGWNRSILTDSGGYQVFSLATLRKIEEEGVTFRSHIDGSQHLLTPEKAVEIQETLGSDIMMVLDECPDKDRDSAYCLQSMERTTRWAMRCLESRRSQNALFAIVQGGMHPELRTRHAAELAGLPFDGWAVGGLSVGEERSVLMEMLSASIAELPGDRPRYFMGLGKPGDILDAVRQGVDMFDCVLPTRSGRTGLLFTRNGELVIKQARYRLDDSPVDPDCACPVCRTFSRAYLRHLFVSREMLGPVLNTIHNLHFYQWMMAQIRASIEAGTFVSLYNDLSARVRRRMEPGEP